MARVRHDSPRDDGAARGRPAEARIDHARSRAHNDARHLPAHPRARPHDAPRYGWTRTGIRLGLALLLAMWATGVVLELWPADATFSLVPWQASLRHGSLVLHGIGTWLACAAIGRWVAPHLPRVWRMRANTAWWLGVASATVAAGMVVTGLLLLYGPGDWHDGIGQAHWWVAVAAPAVVVLHAWLRRRRA